MLLNQIFLVFLPILASVSSARLRSCKNVGNGTTVCMALKNCPSLLKTISPGQITSEAVRKLQKLTCGFDRDDPRVCCPKQDSSLNAHNNNPGSQLNVSYEEHANFKLLPEPGICGTINTPIANRIIGGTIPPHLALPWIVRIGFTDEQKGIAYYCGGTLISERYVLTAAHCVLAKPDDANIPISVRVGEYNTGADPDCSDESGKCSSVQDFEIEKIISHPSYNVDTKFHDIALIRLNDSVSIDSEYIYPICLPTTSQTLEQVGLTGLKASDGSPKLGFVTGWGATRWNARKSSSILRYVFLPVVNNDTCQLIYSGVTDIADTQMCAGALADKDSCDGDSGGPFVVSANNMKHYFQIAVVSYGPTRCGTEGLPGIYTRVSPYIQWILDSMEP